MVPQFLPQLCCVILFGFLLQPGTVLAQANENAPKLVTKSESMTQYEKTVVPFFAKHCNSCHGANEPEGDLHLAKLDPDMESSSAARWALLLSKVTSGEMPPETESRPKAESIKAVAAWIQAEMKRNGKHIAFRPEYANGNKVPHELLFDPKYKAPFDTPARVRPLSPTIYDLSVLKSLGKSARGLSQPFSPNTNSTFKDMGNPKIDEPTTVALINNALSIVESRTGHKLENGVAKKVGQAPKEFIRLFDEKDPASDEDIKKAITIQFSSVLLRKPTDEELNEFLGLYKQNIKDAGRTVGTRYTLAAVFLLPEAIFRWELGGGDLDEQGRVRLQPREIAYAISFALTDKPPSGELLRTADEGKLDTKEGVADAVRGLLNHPKIQTPSILRFFREYFDYPKAVEVFKNSKEFNGHRANILVADTDRLIEWVLEKDQQVLYELLTTEKSFVEYRAAADKKKQREEALKKFLAEKKKNPEKYKNKEPRLPHASTYESYNQPSFSDVQPVTMPKHQRAGVLTQPAWLVAFSKSDENDAIHRGKWVRERLLGGVVPDIPITVDAQLPNNPEMTLRERMHVTREKYCFQCHTYMNRLGLTFEMYDHFGRYRETEPVRDLIATANNVDKKGKSLGLVVKERKVDATGGFEHVPDPKLSGNVNNAIEMLHKLAKSEYVEQVFVRHAFRFWMGRNESLGDAPSLQAAHQACRTHNGSMNELIVALLSSDSFLYRVPSKPEDQSALRE